MTLLEFFFILAWVVILITSLDIASKQKFNAIHFFIFFIIGWGLLTFSIYPPALNKFGNLFGVARWADLLVYISIIFLFYISLVFLKKNVENSENNTLLLREFTIDKSDKKEIVWKEVFLIRVYNESKVLKKVIDSVLDEGYKNILVVNDGSTDNSRKILEWFWNKIILLNHAFNRWWWAALETGFEYLRRYWKVDYVISFDSDEQHDIKDAQKFIYELDKNKDIDIVFGSRFVKWAKTNVPIFRKIILFWWKIFTGLVSWIYLTDSHNWYRAFRKTALYKFSLRIDSMAYASELIEEIRKNDLKYSEIPVNIQYTDYSIKKWQKSSNAIYIALKTIWTKYFR